MQRKSKAATAPKAGPSTLVPVNGTGPTMLPGVGQVEDSYQHPGTSLTEVVADITQLSVDVITNATQASLGVGSGIDRAINNYYPGVNGRGLRQSRRGVPTGTAILVDVSDLTPALPGPSHQAVVLFTGPRFTTRGIAAETERAQLINGYRQAVNLAIARGFQSIALPVVSYGIFRGGAAAVQIAREALLAINSTIPIYLVHFPGGSADNRRIPPMQATQTIRTPGKTQDGSVPDRGLPTVSVEHQRLLNRWSALADRHGTTVASASAVPSATGPPGTAPADGLVRTVATDALAAYTSEYDRISGEAGQIASRLQAGTARPNDAARLQSAIDELESRRAVLEREIATVRVRSGTVGRMRKAIDLARNRPRDAAAGYAGAPPHQGREALTSLLTMSEADAGALQVGQQVDPGTAAITSSTFTVQPGPGRARVVVVPGATTSARDVGGALFVGDADVVMFGPGARFTVTAVTPANPAAGMPMVVTVQESAPASTLPGGRPS